MNLEPVLSQGVPSADKHSLMRGERKNMIFFLYNIYFEQVGVEWLRWAWWVGKTVLVIRFLSFYCIWFSGPRGKNENKRKGKAFKHRKQNPFYFFRRKSGLYQYWNIHQWLLHEYFISKIQIVMVQLSNNILLLSWLNYWTKQCWWGQAEIKVKKESIKSCWLGNCH